MPTFAPNASTTDDLIEFYGNQLQGIYNDRTAGDYTFRGVLSMFLLDVHTVERGQATEPEDVIHTASLASDSGTGYYRVTEILAGGDPDRVQYACECKDFTIRGNPQCKHIVRALAYGFLNHGFPGP